MKYQMALSLLALLASGGCSGGVVTSPASRGSTLSASEVQASSNESVARSGEFHATKECSLFFRRAGEFCTITSSNLKEIPVGTRVYYLSDGGATALDTDVILDPPGPGNNTANGHCTLSLVTGVGACSFSGGTGRFTRFQANVDVSPLGWPDFAWDGTYGSDGR